MNRRDKIQHLLITQLFEEGEVRLVLPDGLTLELGITKEGKNGLVKDQNYCWLQASQDDKTVSLDSYNLGLQFSSDRLVFANQDVEMSSLEVI